MRVILSEKQRAVCGYAEYMRPNETSNLRLDMMKDFLNGGVLKYHPYPTGDNLLVLKTLKIRHFIHIRHPADHLAAHFCNLYGLDLPENGTSLYQWQKHSPDLFPDHIFPFKVSEYDHKRIDWTINNFINNGHLFHTLKYITDWLSFRDVDKSMVTTYEDFINDPKKLFLRIAEFLNVDSISEKSQERINILSVVTEIPGGKNEKYPRGYSG